MQRRTVRRTSKIILTWMVVLMLTLDTASACHPFRYWVTPATCCGPPVHVAQDACCPSPCGPIVVESCEVVVSDCCGAVEITGEAGQVDQGQATHESMRPAQPPAASTELTPADVPPTLPPKTEMPEPPATVEAPSDQSTPHAGHDNQAVPMEAPATGQSEPAAEASPNDLNSLPDTLPSDAAAGTSAKPPARDSSDLFAEPTTEEPATAPPAAEKPAAEPAQPDSNLNDLFSEPASPPPAAAQPPGDQKPVTDTLDDLFSEPAATDSGAASEAQPSGQNSTDQPAPSRPTSDATAPPAASSGDSFDDLFDSTPNADAAPATGSEPAAAPKPATDPVDDLFGNPGGADATRPAASDTDDIFGATPDRTSDARVAEGRDDRFGTAADSAPTLPAAESKPAPDNVDLDDLFGQPAATPHAAAPSNTARTSRSGQPEEATIHTAVTKTSPSNQADAEIASLPMRGWTDNTGTFHTTARLVLVGHDFVRLFKDNGHFTTVPMRRLSQTDRQYVQQHAGALSDQPVAQLAGR